MLNGQGNVLYGLLYEEWRVKHTKYNSALYVSFLRRMVEFSLVPCGPEIKLASRFLPRWKKNLSLDTLKLTQTQGISVLLLSFITCPSKASQNTIDFKVEKGGVVSDGFFLWLTSDTNKTLRFGRAKLSDCPLLWSNMLVCICVSFKVSFWSSVFAYLFSNLSPTIPFFFFLEILNIIINFWLEGYLYN